jgi:hypothetical protein
MFFKMSESYNFTDAGLVLDFYLSRSTTNDPFALDTMRVDLGVTRRHDDPMGIL